MTNKQLFSTLTFAGLTAITIVYSMSNTLPAEAQRNQRNDPNMYYRQPSNMGGKTLFLPIGTTFEGRINSTLSSSHSHAGERFSIILSSPILANGTDVVVPAGSEVLGEVVEAYSASSLPHKRHTPKPRGKLRIQINGMRTPDGVSYPLVGSLIGEIGNRRRNQRTAPLGTGVGYMGTASGFEAVAPGMAGKNRMRPGQAPRVITKREMLSDPLYGLSDDNRGEESIIRSLTLKGRDYYIMSGSPLTVRLDAPLKLGVTTPRMGGPVEQVEEEDSSARNDFPAPSNAGRAAPAETPPAHTPAPETSF